MIGFFWEFSEKIFLKSLVVLLLYRMCLVEMLVIIFLWCDGSWFCLVVFAYRIIVFWFIFLDRVLLLFCLCEFRGLDWINDCFLFFWEVYKSFRYLLGVLGFLVNLISWFSGNLEFFEGGLVFIIREFWKCLEWRIGCFYVLGF